MDESIVGEGLFFASLIGANSFGDRTRIFLTCAKKPVLLSRKQAVLSLSRLRWERGKSGQRRVPFFQTEDIREGVEVQ